MGWGWAFGISACANVYGHDCWCLLYTQQTENNIVGVFYVHFIYTSFCVCMFMSKYDVRPVVKGAYNNKLQRLKLGQNQ